jgi:hypothetical protein
VQRFIKQQIDLAKDFLKKKTEYYMQEKEFLTFSRPFYFGKCSQNIYLISGQFFKINLLSYPETEKACVFLEYNRQIRWLSQTTYM